MLRRRGYSALNLLAVSTFILTACSGSGDDEDTTGTDGGTIIDSGPLRDGGPPRDAGFPDGGPPRDAGHYCAINNQVQVDGVGVEVDPVTDRPMTSTGLMGSTSCIDQPLNTQPQPFEFCLFECVDFLGETVTAVDVNSLEVAVFNAVDANGDPVDPSYDRMTGQDRQPGERLDVGFNFRTIDPNMCDSGWAIEGGFSDLGANTLNGEIGYLIRVASSTSAAFVDTYYPNFIRRNASQSGSSCRLSAQERSSPDVTYDFVVGGRTLIDSAASGAGLPIPGSDDFDDGQGNGYALVEIRDCSNADGRSIDNATAGFTPPALADYYPGDDLDLARQERYTETSGRYLAVGFAGTVATSSIARDIRFGAGLTTDGTCTEEFGGGIVPIQPDSLNVIRVNNETILHSRD